MRRLITVLALIQLAALPFFNSPVRTAARNASLIDQEPQISESALLEKFNKALDEELGDACLTSSAARQLNDLMKDAAATIIQERAFQRVSESETNARQLARRLVANGNKTTSGGVRITAFTVDSTIRPRGLGKLCPLYPFCK